jgi:hypothetical protein
MGKETKDEKRDVAFALLDVSFHYSNRIFRYLAFEGLVQDDDSRQSLGAFFEIVSFVVCWMEREIQRRLSRQRSKDLEPAFSRMRVSWGSFFVDYPEGPRLDGETTKTIGTSISEKCDTYRRAYDSDLSTHGALRALRHACGFLVRMVHNQTTPPSRDKDSKGWDDPEGPVVRQVGELIYSLNRDINVLLFEQFS